METRLIEHVNPWLYRLETFLGGMETPCGARKWRSARPLKPSLVEWKRERAVNVPVPAWSLKPSLVEWKLIQPGETKQVDMDP